MPRNLLLQNNYYFNVVKAANSADIWRVYPIFGDIYTGSISSLECLFHLPVGLPLLYVVPSVYDLFTLSKGEIDLRLTPLEIYL